MKIKVFIPPTTNTKGAKKAPPIPLERDDVRSLKRGDYLAYKLRNVPGDDSSPVYELCVPYFGTGTCEEWLKFRNNLEKVLLGQNVTTGPGNLEFLVRGNEK